MGVGFIPALAGAFCQADGVIDARERRFDLAVHAGQRGCSASARAADYWRLTYARFAILLLRGEFRAAREIAQAYLRQAEVEGRPEQAVAAHRMLGTVKFELGAFSESREEFERCYGDAFEPRICWDFKHLRPTRFK